MAQRPWSRILLACPFALLAVGTGAVSPASAGVPTLFVSPLDDGVDPGAPPTLPGSPSESLYLYLDAGASPSVVGTPCVDGEGDELCQWELVVQVLGDAAPAAFVPDPAQDIVWRLDGGTFAATGGRATTGELGPTRLGELQLAVGATGWTAEVSVGNAVNAGFASVPMATGTIALPEPGASAAALAGFATLAGLARRRRRRPAC